MVSEIHDNNRVCDENGGILSCDGTYEGDKKFMQFKKEKNEMFEFYKKNHCDLSIFHRQLFFDVSVGGEGV